MPVERLQKIIAAAGVASRRKAEQLISAGLVQVNGQTVSELGSKADPDTDHIRVNGKLLHGAQRHIYLLLNKPKGYVTTMSDPEKRPTVMDLMHGVKGRVYPVSRLARAKNLRRESRRHAQRRSDRKTASWCQHRHRRRQAREDRPGPSSHRERSHQPLV